MCVVHLTLSQVKHWTRLRMEPSKMSEITLRKWNCFFFLELSIVWAGKLTRAYEMTNREKQGSKEFSTLSSSVTDVPKIKGKRFHPLTFLSIRVWVKTNALTSNTKFQEWVTILILQLRTLQSNSYSLNWWSILNSSDLQRSYIFWTSMRVQQSGGGSSEEDWRTA